MELIVKHIVYALDGLVVAQCSLNGTSELPNNAQNGRCYEYKRGRHALSSRKMRSVQVRALARAEVDPSELGCPIGTMCLMRVRKWPRID
jgi:hypothetical protein